MELEVLSRRREYSISEIAAAAWFWFRYEGVPVNGPAFYSEDAYDFSTACPVCGSGARAPDPFLVRATEIRSRKAALTSYEGQLLLHVDIVREFERVGITGAEFLPIANRARKTAIPEYRWADISSIWSALAGGHGYELKEPCAACGLPGHFDSLERYAHLRYEHAPASAKDLNPTKEYFSVRSGRLGGFRQIIVSKRAKEILAVSSKQFKFEPVEIVATGAG